VNLPPHLQLPVHGPKLRVAAILDSLTTPAWIGYVLEEINKSECLQLVLLVCNGSDSRRRQLKGLPNRKSPMLSGAWAWLDYRLFRKRSDQPDSLAMVHLGDLTGPRVLHLPANPLAAHDLAPIRGANIDVLLDFTGTATGAVQDCTRYGLWSFATAQSLATSFLIQMGAGRGVLESHLRVLNEKGCQHIGQLIFPTDFISLFRNSNRYFWDQAQTTLRVLLSLQSHGWTYIPKREEERDDDCRMLPAKGTVLRCCKRSIKSVFRVALERTRLREEWFIAYRQRRPIFGMENAPTDFMVVKPPRARLYADPFIVEKNGKTFIFFEDYSFVSKKAIISMIEIDSAGEPSPPEAVLEKSYHLSYPCVFEWNGEMYMLPETKDDQSIVVFRATEFPRRWQRERVLISGVSAVDSTILRYDNRFWLFTCGLTRSTKLFNGDNELFLFSSEELFGPWIPHPRNPIVTDIRRCRPAGQLFYEGKQLIRPSQNCLERYGQGVCFNRVDVLSETDYAETAVASIPGDWYLGNLGTHTFNQSSRYQVVDGRTAISRFVPKSLQSRTLWTRGLAPLVAPTDFHSRLESKDSMDKAAILQQS
jgi:hypothetical protein